MPDADDQAAARSAQTFLPLLAGAALLVLAASITGPLAIVAAAIGGTVIGGAIVSPFLPRDECDQPDSICPPTNRTDASSYAEATAVTNGPATETHWTQRATAATAKRAR